MAETPAVCEHLHLPLQSGSDRVLAAMHRGYTAERYLERLAAARAAVADLAVTTDIIVGLPRRDRRRLRAHPRGRRPRPRYDSAYTFIYSPRPGTEAAERVDDFVARRGRRRALRAARVVVERSALATARGPGRAGRGGRWSRARRRKDPRVAHRPHPPEQARALRRGRPLRPGTLRRRAGHRRRRRTTCGASWSTVTAAPPPHPHPGARRLIVDHRGALRRLPGPPAELRAAPELADLNERYADVDRSADADCRRSPTDDGRYLAEVTPELVHRPRAAAFLVAWLDGDAGRLRRPCKPLDRDRRPRGEIKRDVHRARAARRRGVSRARRSTPSRRVAAELGYRRLQLETGLAQPEAHRRCYESARLASRSTPVRATTTTRRESRVLRQGASIRRDRDAATPSWSGATASGKSALALALARRRPDVELVSVDSMQVYRGMDIGTAKPTPAEQAEVPHHLLDLADPWRGLHRRLVPAARSATRSPTSRPGATGRCSSAAPASTCGPWSTTSTSRAGTPRCAPSSRPSPTPAPCTRRLDRARPGRPRRAWSRPTGAGSCGPSR